MIDLEQLLVLAECETPRAWCAALVKLGQQLGFEQVLYGAALSKHTPLEQAFVRTNFPAEWRANYESRKLHVVDPVVGHCLTSSLPLVWTARTFVTPDQQTLYEEASAFGIGGGITLPIHGPNGEFGMMCFVSDVEPERKFRSALNHFISALLLLRDYAFDSSLKFLRPAECRVPPPPLTNRELEILKWMMAGKSTWEIAKIGLCSEATVNFHIANIRKKFDVNSRGQAVAKALRLGIVAPG